MEATDGMADGMGREKKKEESRLCGRCCGLVANWTECRDSVCELGCPGRVETCACRAGEGYRTYSLARQAVTFKCLDD